MKLAWLTDIHLEFLSPGQLESFLHTLQVLDTDAFLLGGDIAQSHSLEGYLLEMENTLQRDLYFVPGNHDYFYGSIEQVRRDIRVLA